MVNVTDIIIQQQKDIQQLKAENIEADDTIFVGGLFLTDNQTSTDTLTGKSRSIENGSVFILGHQTYGVLGTSRLGSGGMGTYTSGAYAVI